MIVKHLVLCEYGTSLGVTSERLVIKQHGELLAEHPLAALHSITIAKQGVSLSSNLVQACSLYGIRLFFLNTMGECIAALSGIRSHGVGLTRRNQIRFLDKPADAAELAIRTTYGKIRNQRAVLCYIGKTSTFKGEKRELLLETIENLKITCDRLTSLLPVANDCRAQLLGIEGAAASLYWNTWVNLKIFPAQFSNRSGRGARDPINAALNYGYSILMTRVWNATLVAGLEPYLGFYHVERPGKPSLILDLMEEYRAWCVDRVVLKNRRLFSEGRPFDDIIKRKIVSDVLETFTSDHLYHGKRLSLESILQRQIYRLSGHFSGEKKYKPYLFKW